MKLGGSIITVKRKKFTPNLKTINRITKEIKKADIHPLIIVHGGGSFGHPFAKDYEISSGFQKVDQILGFAKTHQAMVTLNSIITGALIKRDIPAVSVQPSAFITTRRGRVFEFNNDLIQRMIKMNFVPVLYGDSVFDEDQGFAILSGDQLVSVLSISLKFQRIVICVDVDGLHVADPNLDPAAKLIRNISLDKLTHFIGNIGKSSNIDVTGGMHGKIAELIPALREGIEVEIVNANKINRLYRALLNKDVKGTKIEP